MKILKVIHGYPLLYNAGSEVYSQSICEELSKNHEITVFTREENQYEEDFAIRSEKRHDNLDVFYVNKRIDKDNYRNKNIDAKFLSILKGNDFDVAHIGHLNHLSTGIIDELNRQKIPIVFTLHDFWLMCPRGQFLQRNYENSEFYQVCDKQEDNKCSESCYNHYFSGRESDKKRDVEYWASWINTRMEETRAMINKVDLFIAPSKYLRDRFVNDFNIPESKIIYLDYGFPTHYLKPKEKSNSENFSFGYIGTHIPAKGVDLLIKAFSQIEDKSTLKIWGRDNGQSTASLKEVAAESQNEIQFFGGYNNENISSEVFANIDCIVVPSIWGENSPLVIHEAQACNIPVITADFGGMKEYVEHMKNGLLFKHRDFKDLQKKMIYAIQNPDVLSDMGKVGYLHNAEGEVPNIEKHCLELTELYDQVIINKK